MRSRALMFLAIVAVAGSGLAAAIAGVVAFESQTVGARVSVSNSLAVTQDLDQFKDQQVFPQEFLVDSTVVGLSAAFLAQARQTFVDVSVFAQCAVDPGTDWMGDFAYFAVSDPGTIIPGEGAFTFENDANPATGGPLPPTATSTLPDAPWVYVGGGAAGVCPSAPIAITSTTLDSGGVTSTSVHLGLDIPVCIFNFNPDTDPTPKPSGYNVPTVIIASGDARFETRVVDPDCAYLAGMRLVFQVTNIY